MKPRREVSPDAELVLIFDQYDDDWIVGFENAPWHMHPEGMMHDKPHTTSDEDAVNDFIDCILNDRSIIVISTRGDVRDVFVLDPDINFTQYDPPTLEAALQAQIESDTRYRSFDERMIYRLWSGKILHVLHESSPQLQPRVLELLALAFAPEGREDARTILACIEDDSESARLRIAAISASKGRLDWLTAAADLARIDYRDLLMAAGFGHDIHAHEIWKPDWEPPDD